MAASKSVEESNDLKTLSERINSMTDEFQKLMMKSIDKRARLTPEEKQRMTQLEKMLSQMKTDRKLLEDSPSHAIDPNREQLLKRQATLKAYYDSFPDIDTLINESSADLRKAEEFTKSILNQKPSGNVSDRDTVCHILNALLKNEFYTCLFFDSANGINLHDASRNLTEISSEKKPFVLKLKNSTGLGADNTRRSEDDLQLVETITNLMEQNKSHPVLEDIRDRLAKVHDVDRNSIIIEAVYAGTFSVVYTVVNLTIATIKKLKKCPHKLLTQFEQFLTAKIHPLLYRGSFDIAFFDARGNKTFNSQPEVHYIGPKEKRKMYTTASGWTRYGLKVLGKEEYGDDRWLHPFQDPGNWYRAFHGTGNAKEVDFGESEVYSEQTAACVDALSSIYQTGFRPARVAVHGPGVYCSPNPTWLESSSYVGSTELDTQQGKKKFKCMLQVAVNPDSVVCSTNEIWVAPNPQDIRPYGILIKEI